jgi:poly(3-hydroxybutyrate) depolymerase
MCPAWRRITPRQKLARVGRATDLARVRLRIFPLLALCLTCTLFAAPNSLPVGPGMVQADLGLAIDVFTYRPPTYTEGPLIVVFHGVQRNAEDYRNFAITLAERFKAIVAAPRFDQARFPYEAYQQGGLFVQGALRAREDWTFSLIPRLIADLRARLGDPERDVYLIGHSAGGQFVVRLAALGGELGAVRLIGANPGSHLFPARDAPYGYGFGNLPPELSNDDAMRRYLAAPLTLYLGTADNDPAHQSLDRSEAAMRQGSHRYARGLACFAAARSLAEDRGWAFNWRLVETPGIAHDAAQMFAAEAARDAIFGAAK